MPTHLVGVTAGLGRNAGADLSALANIGKAVKLNASGEIILCVATDVDMVGVLENNPAQGKTATVAIDDRPMARAGAAYAINALLTTNAAGEFIAATTGQAVLARAMEAATGAGELRQVRIHRSPVAP